MIRIVTVKFDGARCVMAVDGPHKFREGDLVLDCEERLGMCVHDEIFADARVMELLDGMEIAIHKMAGYVVDVEYSDPALGGEDEYVYADALQAAAES